MGLFRTTVNLTFPGGSGGGTNTWHLRTVSDDGTVSEISTLMALIEDFYAEVDTYLPTGYTAAWDGTALQIAVPDPVLLAGATPWSVAGGDTGGTLANGAMVCVTWRTPLATKSGRGRTFVGPVGFSTAAGDGTLGGPIIAGFRAAAANLVTASSLASIAGAVVVWSETLQSARDITGSSVTDQYAFLSSRRS